MSFKDISGISAGDQCFQQSINNCVRFSRVHHEEHFSEIVLNWGQWLIPKICHHCDKAPNQELNFSTFSPFFTS